MVYGLLRRLAPRNDKKEIVIARAEGSWQSHYSWLVIARVRRTRGNLSMGYN